MIRFIMRIYGGKVISENHKQLIIWTKQYVQKETSHPVRKRTSEQSQERWSNSMPARTPTMATASDRPIANWALSLP